MYSDAECPYCGKEIEIDHDDGYGYEEDELYQQECSHCEKTFTYNTSISFSHDTQQAECLNGGEHDFKKTHTYPPEFAEMRCNMCGERKPIHTEKESEKRGDSMTDEELKSISILELHDEWINNIEVEKGANHRDANYVKIIGSRHEVQHCGGIVLFDVYLLDEDILKLTGDLEEEKNGNA